MTKLKFKGLKWQKVKLRGTILHFGQNKLKSWNHTIISMPIINPHFNGCECYKKKDNEHFSFGKIRVMLTRNIRNI